MSKEKLAKKRTDLAVQRNIMANERTYSAWVRTGVSSVLAGLAIVKFIGQRDQTSFYSVFIGILFILAGIFIFILGYVNFMKNLKELEYNKQRLTKLSRYLIFITIAMIISALLILGLLFLN